VLLHIHSAAGPLPVDAWDEDIEIVRQSWAREAFRVCVASTARSSSRSSEPAQLAYDLDLAGSDALRVSSCSTRWARCSMILRSASIFASIPGRRIFRITGVPLGEFGPGVPARLSRRRMVRAQGCQNTSNGGAAERLFDLRQEIVERHRRHVAVQLGEFSGPRRRQKVLSCREQLAEFYEGRPELLKTRASRAAAAREARLHWLSPPLQYVPRACSSSVAMPARRHEVAEPMPGRRPS